jgi:hypothetical protein
MQHARTLLKHFDEGRITENELVYSLFEEITPENVAEVFSSLPPDVQALLVEAARSASDHGYPISFCLGVILRTDEEHERYRAAKEQEQERMRRGIDAVRDFLGENQ